MAFCTNCGEKIAEGTKFCANCGQAVNNTSTNQRKTVYDGEIHKCPNCGETLNSFVSICPSCGFELRKKTIDSSLEKFIYEINECEKLVARSSQAKTGWSSWSSNAKTWWVILNVFFICIPLLIQMVIPLLRINSTPKLTYEEKKLTSLIENFTFPNDRESILAALIFAKEKISFISNQNIDRKTAYWIRLWFSKADQLKQRADVLFPNDNIVTQSYAQIVSDKEKVKLAIRNKALLGIAILVGLVLFVAIGGSK